MKSRPEGKYQLLNEAEESEILSLSPERKNAPHYRSRVLIVLSATLSLSLIGNIIMCIQSRQRPEPERTKFGARLRIRECRSR